MIMYDSEAGLEARLAGLLRVLALMMITIIVIIIIIVIIMIMMIMKSPTSTGLRLLYDDRIVCSATLFVLFLSSLSLRLRTVVMSPISPN